jgi:hypothetical protein
MATRERLPAFISARPFQAFTIKMASGERFTIRLPENVACDERGRNLAVFDNGMHLVEMLRVEVMSLASVTDSKQENNGP